jgi:hypothetical protein
MNNNDELDIQHRVLIVEEEIEISELPKEIINAIRSKTRRLFSSEQKIIIINF